MKPTTKTQGPLSTELLLSHPNGFGLTTITPAQRAICRAIDGLPIPDDIWEYEDPRYAEFGSTRVADIFGGVRPPVGVQPWMVILLSGARCGKTTLISAVAAKAALGGVDIDSLDPKREKARVSILSSRVDVAHATFDHVLGGVQTSRILRSKLVGKPRANSFDLQHRSGKLIQVYVAAQSRTGVTLNNRWCAGCIIDEAPRQASGADGFVVNIEDQISTLKSRVRPGAQVFLPGSPVGPSGYVYTQFQEHFGNPTDRILVIRSPAYLLNPSWWTYDVVAQLRDEDEDDWKSECMGEFRGADGQFFPVQAIEDAFRAEGEEELPPQGGRRYYAAIDPATRANAFTACIAGIDGAGTVQVSYARQWVGTRSAPLSPASVFAELKPVLDRYAVSEVVSDQWSFDSLKDIARGAGIRLKLISVSGRNKFELYDDLKARFIEGSIKIPKDQDIRSDLLMVRKRITPRGEPTVVLQASTGGRHCDYAACLALLNQALTYTPRFPTYDPSYNRYLPGLRTFGL